MEPSPLSDGNHRSHRVDHVARLASMEPSPLSDGNAEYINGLCKVCLLQWSRRLSATEIQAAVQQAALGEVASMEPSPLSDGNVHIGDVVIGAAASLQWSRRLSATEMWNPHPATLAGDAAASMEPS